MSAIDDLVKKLKGVTKGTYEIGSVETYPEKLVITYCVSTSKNVTLAHWIPASQTVLDAAAKLREKDGTS